MSEVMFVLGLLVGLVVGAAALWFVLRARADAASEASRASVNAEAAQARADAERARGDQARADTEVYRLREELARTRQHRSDSDLVVANAQAQVADMRATVAGVEASLVAAERERDAAVERATQLAADREQLVLQFKTLASETLEHQGKLADASAEQRLKATEQLMGPVSDQLKALQTRLIEVEKERASIAADLRGQVTSVVLTTQELRRETAALSTALRTPQVRGSWGETQLKRVVEMAGMVEHCDFLQQETTTHSSDATMRPDLKVLLGDGKFLYVDAKVPLVSFLNAFSTDDEAARAEHLGRFGKNVRTHVDQLAAKSYFKAGSGSPEFVVMFIGSEALASQALQQQPDLQEYAWGKGVVIASPATLIAVLRAVAYSWKQASLADNMAQVFELGRELHDRLSTLGTHVDKLGRSLTSSVKAYNSAVGSLEGRVFVQARKFRDLHVTDNDLPELHGVDESVRNIAAHELVESAQVDVLMGRRDPDIAELVDETQPRLLEGRRKQG